MSNKTYGGIVGHESEKDIAHLVLIEKGKGTSLRDISDLILKRIGLTVSHTMISKYYKEVLDGDNIDIALASSGGGGDSGELMPIEIDPKRLEVLEEKYKHKNGDDVGLIMAYAVALCEHNIQAHVRGEAPLKQNYIKYLKEVRLMAKD
jgi:hypothetical protein